MFVRTVHPWQVEVPLTLLIPLWAALENCLFLGALSRVNFSCGIRSDWGQMSSSLCDDPSNQALFAKVLTKLLVTADFFQKTIWPGKLVSSDLNWIFWMVSHSNNMHLPLFRHSEMFSYDFIQCTGMCYTTREMYTYKLLGPSAIINVILTNTIWQMYFTWFFVCKAQWYFIFFSPSTILMQACGGVSYVSQSHEVILVH